MAARRQVSIYINGREIANNLKAIAAEKNKVNRELRRMVVGSDEYNEKMNELRQLSKPLKDHRDALRGVESTWQKLSKAGVAQFAAITAGAFTVDAVVQYGKELFNLGAELEVLTQKAQTVFGFALPQVTRAAEENATAMGLTISQYTKAATEIGDLLIPMGFMRDEAATISTNLVDLSGALSEWTGGQIRAEEVSRILSKALLGEREELKQLGISIQEADVQARLAEKGMKGLTGEALQQAKAMATLELVTEKSVDAQTAFAENSDTLVRQQAELRAKIQQLNESIATALIPIFNTLVGAANSVADSIGNFLDPVKAATDAFDDQQSKVQDLESELPGLLSRYEELQDKSNRSKEEQDELSNVIKRIGDLTPTAITQINEYGEALGINADASREFLEAEKARLEFVNKEAIGALEDELDMLQTLYAIQVRMAQTGERGGIISSSLSAGEIDDARKKAAEFAREIKGIRAELARLRGDNLDRPGPAGGGGGEPDTISPTADEIEAAKKRAETLRKEREKQAEREQKELERKLENLKAITERFQEESRLAALEEDDRKLEEIRLRYEKEIETAKELEAQKAEEVRPIIEELYRLQQEALAAARQEIDDELYQAELETIEEQIDAELELMAEGDERRLEQLQQRNEREQDEREKAAEKAIEAEKKKLKGLADTAGALSSITGSFLQAAGEEFAKNTASGKILTAINIALASAEGIAKAVAAGAGVPFPANLGAIASGVAAVAGGIASARAALAEAPAIPQRAKGGWFGAIGQDDGRYYRAQYIGQPATGMLPSHPVLINSASGGPVLASERGAEYFVSNRSLQNPAVLNYVRAIDNIQRTRQFQDGGFTLQPPATATATPTPPQPSPADMRQLTAALTQLSAILGRGIYARLDDDTIIDLRDRLNQLIDASGGVL